MHNSQEVANRIKLIAKEKNIAVGKMLSDCDLSKNALSSMQSGGFLPRLENIIKIADYLDCSVDYLLGRSTVVELYKEDNSHVINFTERIETQMNESLDMQREKIECFGYLLKTIDLQQLKKNLSVLVENYGFENLVKKLNVQTVDMLNFFRYTSDYDHVVLEKLDVLFKLLNTNLYDLLRITDTNDFVLHVCETYKMFPYCQNEINTILGKQLTPSVSDKQTLLVAEEKLSDNAVIKKKNQTSLD